MVGQVDEALDTFDHVLKEDPTNKVARFQKQQALNLIEEAKNSPGGYVYRIKGEFANDDAVPFEAISAGGRSMIKERLKENSFQIPIIIHT
ncbi:MAG: hypothetical protein ACFE9A_21455 [Candidatus Hodarchaeota archaeon]